MLLLIHSTHTYVYVVPHTKYKTQAWGSVYKYTYVHVHSTRYVVYRSMHTK